MVAKPRPNKNSNGVNKAPTMTRTINSEPAKPQPAPTPPPAPGMPPPGTANPMTHPAHPQMQSAMGTQAPGPKPGFGPPGPTSAPQDQRQTRETIQFKDLPPPSQAQVEQQQGIDPYAPLKMVQQETQGAIQGGPSTGSIPNELAGPFVPPGVESFPDDFSHLNTLMQQGFAPGASNQEHEFAANSHAIANAKIHHAFAQGQQGAGQVSPMQPPGPAMPMQNAPQVGLSPGIPTGGPGMPPPDMNAPPGGPPPGGPPPGPTASPLGLPMGPPPGGPPAGPPMASDMGTAPGQAPGGPAAPPMAPGAPGGLPPELLHAIMQKHLGKGKTR